MNKKRFIIIVVLILVLAFVLANATFFEDGSIGIFRIANEGYYIGLCLNPGWGCTNWINEFASDLLFGNLSECGIDCPYEDFGYPDWLVDTLYNLNDAYKWLMQSGKYSQ